MEKPFFFLVEQIKDRERAGIYASSMPATATITENSYTTIKCLKTTIVLWE